MRGVSWLALMLSLIVFRLPGIPALSAEPEPPDEIATAVYIETAPPAGIPHALPIAATATPAPVFPSEPPPSPEPDPTPDPEPPFLDIPLLIGPNHPLPEGYIPESLVTVIPGQAHQLAPEAADAYRLLMAAAAAEGIQGLRLVSSFRCYDTQASLFGARVAAMRPSYGSRAEDAAARVVARPGTSEHQSGLAIDISTSWSLHTSFGRTPAGIWLAENSWRFGYILRYPQGKTAVTGVMYEPWHFRYIGAEHAAAMFEKGFVLEEYVEWLQDETAPEETP
jgi:D-alanyl-D-alanine carboxypeptidase